MRSGLAILVLGLGAIPLDAARAQGGASTGAVFNGEMEVIVGNYWVMRIEARDGVWEPVRRSKPKFTAVDYGYVVESEGDTNRLKLAIHMRKDGGHPPAYVFYDIELRRTADGRYTGNFTANETGKTSSGDLSGFLRPPQPLADRQPAAVAADEHPRMLFRKSDIPKLRAKLQTPFGQAFLEKARKSNDPVVLGVLYQATGDPQYAAKARDVVAGYEDIDPNGGLSGDMGHGIVRVALTYDLCYDAWPQDFRDGLRAQIRSRLPKRQYALTIGHANYNPASNYYGPGFGSAALATLALYADLGPCPEDPTAPLCVTNAGCRIAPAADYQPPSGVPVVAFKNDAMPTNWIYVGGFKPKGERDLLEKLGGLAGARPKIGDEVTDGKRAERFRPVSREPDRGYFNWHNQDVISVTAAIGRIYDSVSYFYTVIENDKPRWVEYRIGADHQESVAYLGGVRIEEGHIVNIGKGLYPLLIKVRIGQTEPWGQEMIAPRFVTKTEAQAQEIDKALKERHEEAMRFHRTETAQWKRLNGMDLDCLRMVHKGQEQMFWHYRMGIGDGGFQAEVSSYGNTAARYPMLYAVCFRSTFGRDASPYPDTTHLLPRQMMQSLLKKGAHPTAMNMNVYANFNIGWLADYFPLVPEQWKPGLLWAWNSMAGVETASARELDRAAADRIVGAVDGLSLASTFVNYPVDMDPVHPSRCMPLTWAADTLGFYVFRSGWQGKDEFIAQVFLKSIPIGAWNHPNAGAFRLWGLGHPWTSAPIERSGYRPEESIVLFPDDVTDEDTCARLTGYAAAPDGSGSLSADMNDVYLTAKPPVVAKPSEKEQTLIDIEKSIGDADAKGDDLGLDDATKSMRVTKVVEDSQREKERAALKSTIPRLYDWYGRRIPGVDKTSAITGRRTFAFDYSGASGAPCLMAMADTIRGGKTKQWLWHVPSGDDCKVRVDGRSFTISYPDASLKATFVFPADVKPAYKRDFKMSFIYRGGSAGGTVVTRSYNFLAGETKAKDVDFFVVVTVQRGTAPAVEVKGEGLGATATVGGQTVRYQDGKIVIGNP